jgi:novobiocin biosynthesis protein NovU/D-mycarose 3-C-methyltransferase
MKTPWYHVRETCRVCGTALPAPYLDLGEQPLANALRTFYDKTEEKHAPLEVVKCTQCHLSQLTVVVEPEILFHKDYPFASGTSGAWRQHTNVFAKSLGWKGDRTPGPFAIDVAANDGTQLHNLRCEGWRVLGVDPAEIPPLSVGLLGNRRPTDVPILHRFWGQAVADEIKASHGTADLIVAQNVLGHVDDPVGFLTACASVLYEHGRIVIEVPHVGELLEQVAFDTVYHEHLSYWSLAPLEQAAMDAGLVVVDVEHLDVHGGSRRYYLAKWPHPISTRVLEERELDAALQTDAPYREFQFRTLERLALTKELLESVAGKRMWAFGASAKGAVMLNALPLVGNQVWPTRIMDDTPEKQGKRIPGLGIQVLPTPDNLALIDILWLLSWNWTDALMCRARSLGFRGQFLVTHPEPRLIPASIAPEIPDDCVPSA